MGPEDFEEMFEQYEEIMDYMLKAALNDYTGGNMALRVGEKIYSTQTKASINYRWKLHPDDIIVSDLKSIFESIASDFDVALETVNRIKRDYVLKNDVLYRRIEDGLQ
jgi:hypothetical protein